MPGIECSAHLHQPPCDPRPIMGGFGGAASLFGKPLHLFVQCPPAARVGRVLGEDLEGAEHVRHDADIAFSITPDLVERLGQQTFKGRCDGDHTQFVALVAERRRKLSADQLCQHAMEDHFVEVDSNNRPLRPASHDRIMSSDDGYNSRDNQADDSVLRNFRDHLRPLHFQLRISGISWPCGLEVSPVTAYS